RPPEAAVQAVMRGYVAWALEFPQRFKLVYGSWSKGSDELAVAAGSARALFTGVVTAAQQAGQLPAGDPERLASLLLALAHGAVVAHPGHAGGHGGGADIEQGRGEAEDLLAGPYHGPPDVTRRQDNMPGRGREFLDVVGHQRAVSQVDPGEQEVLLVVVPVRGQVGERGAVQGLQRGR